MIQTKQVVSNLFVRIEKIFRHAVKAQEFIKKLINNH